MQEFVLTTVFFLAAVWFDLRPKWKAGRAPFFLSAVLTAAGYFILVKNIFF
ncbi:MAG: hypothetical protein LBU86_03820 [Oscillospiraceae bacterium]|jgi:hypothetical protein|nr:hypothetical protein [Oscillospiraceae bacterium]